MFHSIINFYDVFCDTNVVDKIEYVNINGGNLECVVRDGKRVISRLNSTDPYLYLNENFRPNNFYTSKGEKI